MRREAASASRTLSVRTTLHADDLRTPSSPSPADQHGRRPRRHHRRQGGAMGQWRRYRCVVLETTEDSFTKDLV